MQTDLSRYAKISIAVAVANIALKAAAYGITGSVGLLSDAIESLVNVVGGIMALAMLTVAARPADDDHPFGHGKAEYFSSGVEGAMILLAAVGICWAAIPRFLHPQALEGVGAGLAVTTIASLLNLATALWIYRAGKKHGSITLEANAKHLLTDVWTSIGVIVAIGLVAITGWSWLDPLVAVLVALNIVWTGVGIIRRSIAGLMDPTLDSGDRARLDEVLARYQEKGIRFHAVMTRQAGMRRFVSMHVLVPGEWTVQQGHELLEEIEADIRTSLSNCHVITHLEPAEDPKSFEDERLERKDGSGKLGVSS